MKLSEALARHGLECLVCLTHPANVESILNRGLLSYNQVTQLKAPHESLANISVQWRRNRTVFGRSLHDYVPLYLARRNPMLWAVSPHPHVYVRVKLEAATSRAQFSATETRLLIALVSSTMSQRLKRSPGM